MRLPAFCAKSGAFDPDIILTLNHNPLTMVNLMLTHLSID